MKLIITLLRNSIIRRLAIFFISSFAFILLIFLSTNVIRNKYIDDTKNLTDRHLGLAESISQEIIATLNDLNRYSFKECDELLIYLMRTEQYKSKFIKDIGYSKDNKLICSSGLGILKTPYSEIKPHLISPSGYEIWFDVPIKLFNFNKAGTVIKYKNFNAVLNLDEFLSISKKHFSSAIFMYKGDSNFQLLSGPSSLIVPETTKNRLWIDLKGFHSYKCDMDNLVCVYSTIPLSKIINLEINLIIGFFITAALLTMFTSYFTTSFFSKLIKLKSRLMVSLDSDHIITYYQPLIDIESNRIIGCEVLARWQDLDGTIVFPEKFLKVIRKQKKTEHFTNIIIKRAFDELSDVIRDNKDFKISFNIFPIDFDYASICNYFNSYKAAHPNVKINIELTEDELVEAPILAAHINMLREEDFLVSIDDFGTGYSSLGYLQELNVDYIKIDKSFIKDMEIGTVKSQLLPHIVSISKTINAKVIAEGIEHKDHLLYLKGLGVEIAQGYYFSRPVPFGEFLKLLNK